MQVVSDIISESMSYSTDSFRSVHILLIQIPICKNIMKRKSRLIIYLFSQTANEYWACFLLFLYYEQIALSLQYFTCM